MYRLLFQSVLLRSLLFLPTVQMLPASQYLRLLEGCSVAKRGIVGIFTRCVRVTKDPWLCRGPQKTIRSQVGSWIFCSWFFAFSYWWFASSLSTTTRFRMVCDQIWAHSSQALPGMLYLPIHNLSFPTKVYFRCEGNDATLLESLALVLSWHLCWISCSIIFRRIRGISLQVIPHDYAEGMPMSVLSSMAGLRERPYFATSMLLTSATRVTCFTSKCEYVEFLEGFQPGIKLHHRLLFVLFLWNRLNQPWLAMKTMV